MKYVFSILKDLQNESISNPLALDGESKLSIPAIFSVAHSSREVRIRLSPTVSRRSNNILKAMRAQIANGTPIYGVTSAYGGQAGLVLNQGLEDQRYQQATRLSEAISHVDVSTGPDIPIEIVRAAILIRVNMLVPGYSAIRPSTLNHLIQLLNQNLTPVVGFYGTLGASGDLAHNGRILSVLRHDPHAFVRDHSGQKISAKQALQQAQINQLTIDPKEGLAIVNGDNFSSAACVLQAVETLRLMYLNMSTNALIIQALHGSNRNFHPLLSIVRPHAGQDFVAKSMLVLLKGSKLSYDELKGPKPRESGELIQDGYSIRCLPQFMGPNWETLEQVLKSTIINCNSVSDNPLWTTPNSITQGEAPYQWISGGNFLAMYMSDALDKIRKILIHIVKLNDRHLARLVNPHQNNGLNANLSDDAAVSQCTFKGLQTQMGMYEVFASSLATPISTAFGVHEELNQDITSHAMTSAYVNQEVLRLTRYALATNLIAGCQAIDLRGDFTLLSPATLPIYEWVRTKVPYIKTETPLGHYVETIANEIDTLYGLTQNY